MKIKINPILIATFILSLASMGKADEKLFSRCQEKAFIVIVNNEDASTKEDILVAWRSIVYPYALDYDVASSTEGTMSYTIKAKRQDQPSLQVLQSTVEKLQTLKGVAVECDGTLWPLPGMSGSN